LSLWDSHLDWRDLTVRPSSPGPDVRLRLRLIWLGFVSLTAIVFVRVVQLELNHGDDYRSVAAAPLRRERALPGVRGRILARDGTVLAADEPRVALAVHYRYLETPPNKQWLRNQARPRLTQAERRDRLQLTRAEEEVLRERNELHRRLAEVSGLLFDDWAARLARIQRRVEAISDSVNRRRLERAVGAGKGAPASGASSLESTIHGWLHGDEKQPGRAPAVVTVAEELDYHVVVEGLPVELVAEIEGHPERYPGVRIELRRRRTYPQGSLAAHTIGHLGSPTRASPNPGVEEGNAAPDADLSAPAGVMGVERTYELRLRGAPGIEVELTDHGGRILSTNRRKEPTVGRDLVLTIDLPLQRAAEGLLDSAISRRLDSAAGSAEPGGAIVVLNVHSGAVLASASSPRFSPRSFSDPGGVQAAALLADPSHPLFDRVCRMAIPPGSVFKALTAAALVQSGVDPAAPYYCQGYLEQPDRLRCLIFTRFGTGHAEMNLADALAQSCNVYFFHAAAELGPAPLVDWGRRFGFGLRTGIDLPDEVAGRLATPGAEGGNRGGTTAQTQAMAIGQGTMLVTPLQVGRLMAAIANGGQLVTPHIASSFGLIAEDGASDDAAPPSSDANLLEFPPPRPIDGLSPQALAAVRDGLERVVSEPQGTGYETVRFDAVPIAGKTGTAETGGDQDDHAWFAGYAPADAPRVAFAIVLEHAGSGSTAAGPIARRLVERMLQLGYFPGR
jgi:penicillin-binding protein 2